jgi:hypothetical protein
LVLVSFAVAGIEVRRIGADNLEAVIHILNASSRGHSFAYNLDVVRFLAMARLWDVSYAHSFAGYCDGEPAGVVLNSVDEPGREAYSLYWGVLPAFRGRGVLSLLCRTYMERLRREGYTRVHGDARPDSSWRVFDKQGWRRTGDYVGLEAAAPAAASAVMPLHIRALGAEELLSLWPQPPGETRCWTQTAAFIRKARSFLEIAGAFYGGRLEAYCVFTRWPGHTLLLDLRRRADAAARQLISHLAESGCPPPYEAYMAQAGSPFHELLRAAGFVETGRIASIALDLAGRRPHEGCTSG